MAPCTVIWQKPIQLALALRSHQALQGLFLTIILGIYFTAFLAGFCSQDLILENTSFRYLFFFTGLTVCYLFRLFYYTIKWIFKEGCKGIKNSTDKE